MGELEDAKMMLTAFMFERDALRIRVEMAEKERDDARAALARVEAELGDANVALAEEMRRTDAARAERDALRTELQGAREAIFAKDDECAYWNKLMCKAVDERDALREALDACLTTSKVAAELGDDEYGHAMRLHDVGLIAADALAKVGR